MKKNIILLAIGLLISLTSIAQSPGDTIRVQTFTHDSAARNGIFNFDIDTSLTYEKVIMKYNMRCHGALVNQSGGNGIACGEWDYSCNTFVSDSMYQDSVKSVSPDYTITNFSGNSFDYTSSPTYTYIEYAQQNVNIASTLSETTAAIGNGSTNLADAMQINLTSGKSQYIYRATELLAGGIVAGDITGINLDILNTGSTAEFFRIQMAETADTNLFEGSPLSLSMQEVYFLNFDPQATGNNHFQFYNPFTWDGISNIVVEFSFTNSSSQSNIEVQGEMTSDTNIVSNNYDEFLELGGTGQYLDAPDGTYDFSNGFSFSSWVKFDDLGNWSRIMDFGNGAGSDNIIIAHPGTSTDITLNVRQGGSAMSISASGVIVTGKWMHIAATISSGYVGKIYINGQLAQTGTVHLPLTLARTNNYIGRSNWSNDAYFYGGMDDFSLWSAELSQAEIQDWMFKKVDATHPQFSNLVLGYDCNSNTVDLSSNGNDAILTNGARTTLFPGVEKIKNFDKVQTRPNIEIVQGDYSEVVLIETVTDTIENFPNTITQYDVLNNELIILNTTSSWEAGYSYTYDTNGIAIDSTYNNIDGTINIGSLNYYSFRPMKFELTSFVTPYGIGLDLGQEGKTYTMDVSEYINVLRGKKYMSMEYGGQNQEEFDIEFLYIVGTPPADVLDFRQIWWANGPNHNQINDDAYFEPRDVPTPVNGEHFIVKAAITGHGQDGEFIPRNHMINIDGGFAEFNWTVWKECAENPVYPQGGTWVYDRAGWCPGMETDIERSDISAYVTPGSTVNLDYDIEQFTSSSSTYRNSLQMISYGAANFDNDASISDIIKPSKKIEYDRLNPMCHNPEVVIKNTGGNVLTSANIFYRISGGDIETYNWTGSLDFMEKETVIITPPDAFWKTTVLAESDALFEVWVEDPNGVTDEYSLNDKMSSTFVVPDTLPSTFVLQYRGNNFPGESALYVYDEEGNVVHSNTNWTSSYAYDTLTLAPGCYRLYSPDSDDDGLSWWANNDGSGDLRIAKANTFGYLKVFNADFGDNINWYFTINYDEVTSVENSKPNSGMFIYPNPNDGNFNLELRGYTNDIEVTIVSAIGRLIKTFSIPNDSQIHNTIALNGLKHGVYFVKANDGTLSDTQRIIIN